MANDVEENPGPTIYDVVDPTKTICADFSQGNTKKFRQNAGKQCLAMSLTAIIYNHITNANAWDSTVLNSILCAGNNLYSFISNSVKKSYLLLTDVPEMVSVFDGIYCMQYGEPFAGDLFMANTALPYYSIENALNNLFMENYQHCMLTIGCNTVAIFKTSEGTFKVFDSHSRDLYGIPHPFGKCILASVDSIESLVIYFQSTIPPGNETPFEVKGVTVQLNSDITQISGLASSESAKEHVKQKYSELTESQKQTRLENARKYKKAKQAAETETEKQTRLENAREYQKAKRASETENEKQTRLRNVRNYEKRKQGQETEIEKQACLASANQNKRKRLCSTHIVSQQDYLNKYDIEKDGSIHEQSWAQFNINKFYKSIQFFINQCTICHEAWPLNSKPRSPDCYICSRCARDTKSPRKFSLENSMIPSPVPTELQNLTQVEEMLVARALPIMRVYIKPGGQRGYSGHCVNLPQNVKELATSLPRYPKDLSVIIVKVKGKDNSFRDVAVRREKVHNALLWLVQNNPHYAELEINEDALNSLPENGIPADLMTVETENEIISNDDAMSDLGPPTDNPSEDIVYNNSTDMNSFLPVGEQQEQEIEAVRNQLSANEPIPWPAIECEPLNEYQISHLATMAFPTLFPDGKGDPTNQSILRNVPLQERIKHLLKFSEFIDGKWVYRFANHPRFSYWAFNMIHRKRILQQSGIFIKQNPGEAHLTIDELREMAASDNSALLMSKVSRYIGNIAGTNAYWNKVREELKAIITNVGAPTLFFTFSSADMHWPELHALFGAKTGNATSQIRRQNVINNPH
ncbi:ATP-dependent DNA helicase PIF1, partial [Paramuricea clavata]